MKVVCNLCEFEEKGLCIKKKRRRVKLNKKRQCNVYIQDDNKVNELVEKRQNAKPIPSVFRPEWWHDRKAYKNKLKELDKEKRRREAEMQPEPKKMPIESVKRALTGDDFSRFKSTAAGAVKDKAGPNIKSK